jgi:hypothetical protein
MKKQFLPFLGLLLLSIFFFDSCTEDGTIDPGPDRAPTIRLVSASGFISSSAFVTVGQTMQFRVNAAAGDNNLSLLTILENNKNVELQRITFPSGNPFGSNPAQVLNAADQQAFTHDFFIAAPTTPGNYEYTFQIRDAGNMTASTSVTISVEATAPAVSLVDTPSAFEAGAGSLARVKIDVVKGTFDLATIAVYENNVLMDASRVFFDNGALQAFASNPVATPNQGSFQATLAIQIADSGESAMYGIDVADAQGLVGSVNIDVSIGTGIDTIYTGVLVYNRDGQQFGGLNLYTGASVRFDSPDAQLRDLGIDLGQPTANNWIQKIIPVNNAVLKTPGMNQPEGFSFESITSREALVAAFDAGVQVAESEKVMVDDIFLVRKDDDYFILKVTKVVVTPADNNDYYEFSIKKSEM